MPSVSSHGEDTVGTTRRRSARRTVTTMGTVSCLAGLASLVMFGLTLSCRWSRSRRRRRSSPPPRVRRAGGHAVDSAIFEPGSCRTFAPTAGDRHQSVFLDAGHGSIDPGSVGVTESGQTVYEATETLAVELDTLALLRADGFTVTVSRTGNSPVARPQPGDVSDGLYTVAGDLRDVASRDICADMAKADILVGIYFDAGYSTLNAGSITGLRHRSPVRRRQPPTGHAGANGRAGRHERTGLGHPRRRRGVRHPPRRPGPFRCGRSVRTPASPGPGRSWLLLHPEHHARSLDRAALHHRPLRGKSGQQRTRTTGDRPRRDAAVEQYFGPPKELPAVRSKSARAAQLNCGHPQRDSKRRTAASRGCG